MIGFGVQTPAHKEVLAILAADLFPGNCLWLARYCSDPLASQRATLAERLGVAAIAIIFGISTQTCADRVKFDVSSNGGQCLAPFKQNTLKPLGPKHPVATVTAVVALGEATFEFLDTGIKGQVRDRSNIDS
jgi:hypothetical protein